MKRIVLLSVLGLLSLPLTANSTERDKSTPQEVFDAMRAAFRPEKAIGVHARYQFLISGPQGGEWWIEVNDGKDKMGRGRIENPDVTLVASEKDWVALSNDKLSGVWASLTGRLKVRGSQPLARKLDEMFP
jgi:putative sterol carrier protein